MSNNTQPAASGGIGFLGLLTIVFITLKLTGVISWSRRKASSDCDDFTMMMMLRAGM